MFTSNGVNGSTGAYLTPPLAAQDMVHRAMLDRGPAASSLVQRSRASEKRYGTRFGVDPLRLDSSGWGVLFAQGETDEVRAALQPLLAWRREQAKERFHEYAEEDGHTPGLSKESFLIARGSAPGQPVDPALIPYYLLLVGGADRIPFDFQYELGMQYAVGRVAFATAAEYASYANSVVRAEQGQLKRQRRVAFFGPSSADDEATLQSSSHLVAPLAQSVHAFNRAGGWQDQVLLGAEATRQQLAALIASGPALLFTASHGVGFPSSHPLQARDQGALLCADWPGPLEHAGPLPTNYYLSGDDVARGPGPGGLIAMHFACFGAGTPEFDDFSAIDFASPASVAWPARLAPTPMIAPLVQHMLGHPGGGALAVVGHIDRAWGWSFAWPGTRTSQLGVFEDTLNRLLAGQPVGHAMEQFKAQHGDLAASLTMQLQKASLGKRVTNADELAGMWTAHNDARNYVVMGDPAVRLAV